MAAYIVATVNILDPERFAVYAKSIAGLSELHGGQPLLKGIVAEALEGGSPVGERIVVTRFDSAADARRYVTSPEYQAAALHRAGAAEVAMRLVIDP